MINLLPYTHRADIKAASLNTRFLRYFVLVLVAAALVSSITGIAYVTLLREREVVERKTNESNKLLSKLNGERVRIENFKKEIKTAQSLSSLQANYSEIFTAIGSALPDGAVIQELNIDPSTIDKGITMTVYATDKDTVSQVKVNMQEESKIFENVSFQSIDYESCEADSDYPCTAFLNVTFNKDVLGRSSSEGGSQ